MSIEPLVRVADLPWSEWARDRYRSLKTSEEIADAADLTWTVSSATMSTIYHPTVKNYSAIFREDTNEILGVVNRPKINIIQNSEAFRCVEMLLSDSATVESVSYVGCGHNVFACIDLHTEHEILGDKIQSYAVVINEHNKSDGKITLAYSPVRIVCNNMIADLAGNSAYRNRYPVYTDKIATREIAKYLVDTETIWIKRMQERAIKLAQTKISPSQLDDIVGTIIPDKADPTPDEEAQVELNRDLFLSECLDADNIQNFKGSLYAVMNAATDYLQHYVIDLNTLYDQAKMMSKIPGFYASTSTANMFARIEALASL